MKPSTAFAGALSILLLLGLSGSGCVRLDEPESFRCRAPEDCLAGEHCGSLGRCLAVGECDSLNDCQSTQTCHESSCVAAQCLETNAAGCGLYKCQTSQRTCFTACTSDYDCKDANLCDQGVCRPSPNLPNGSSCNYNKECAGMVCCGAIGLRTCAFRCP